MSISSVNTVIIPKVNPRFRAYNHISENFIAYGEENGYPTRMKRLLDNSPTGVSCRNKLVEFLVGDGFIKPEYNNLIINRRNETLYEILNQLAECIADYHTFHLHATYNLNYEIDSFVKIDPEQARKSSPDSYGFSPKVILYNDWYRDNMVKAEFGMYHRYEVDVFNEKEDVIKTQIEKAGTIRDWDGQILSFWGNAPIYPKTLYDSVIDDLQTDAMMSAKSKVDLEKGYMAGHVLMINRKLSQTEKASIVRDLTEVQGSEGNRVMLLSGDFTRDDIDLKTFQSNYSDGQFTLTEERVRKTIFRAFGQLPILHGEDRANAISADGKAIEIAFRFYNKTTQKMRSAISRALSRIMAAHKLRIEDDFEIEPLKFEIAKENQTIEPAQEE